jgi:hypothetical protein
MTKRLFLFAAALLLAAPALAADKADDGLVARKSRNLDKVRTAATWPATYQAVHIPPIAVEFQPLGDANAIQRPGSRPSNEDVKRASQQMAQSLRTALQDRLQKAGYQVAPAPGPGVLVLKTSLEDVRVNSPGDGVYGGAGQKNFVAEAGEARLHIEGFDGASNAKVLAIDDRGRPRAHMPGVERANSVTNRFWFEDLFDYWAEGVASALPGAKAG